ncbi:Increased recombination centers protein 19 [Bienertia sinuspersici]
MIQDSRSKVQVRHFSWVDEYEEEMEDDKNSGKSLESNLVKIDADEIINEIEYWSNTIVCFVLGDNPSFVGVFLVRFLEAAGCSAMISGGTHMFDKKPLIVK